MRTRLLLGAVGVALGLFGLFRLFSEVSPSDLLVLLIWVVAAVVLHDGVLSPIVVAVSAGLERVIRPRARRFVQFALITLIGVTVIALPMIHLEGTQPTQKALLRQDYATNLGIVAGIVAALALLAYLGRAAFDRTRTGSHSSDTNDRPPGDVHSSADV